MLKVRVGNVVEVTAKEAHELRNLGSKIERLTRRQDAGWLLELFQAHKAMLTIFRQIMHRSHGRELPDSDN